MIIKVIGSSSRGNCYVVEQGNGILILDAGVRVDKVLKAINFRLDRVIGVLVTHEHGDHAKYVRQWLEKGIEVYMSKGTQDALKVSHHRIKFVYHLGQVSVGPFNVMPLKAFHDCMEPLSYLISGEKMVVFATDTYKFPYKFKGINIYLMEANYSNELILEANTVYKNRVIKSHLSLDNAVDILKRNIDESADKIMLIHLSGGHSNEQLFVETIQKATGIPTVAAAPGIEIEVT